MPAQVVIRDGSPHWYLSPDIWVVPGNDPEGPVGAPVAGQPAYVWARVQNTGNSDADGVRVDYYWANPALQVTRSNATLIGSAFADVPAGDTQEVLCLVAWQPVIVNNGHECLVAVANHPADPLPSPLPDAFDPPTYHQVAQKNLSVLSASPQPLMFALTVAATQRVDKAVRVLAEVGGKLDPEALASLGLGELRPADRDAVRVGLTQRAGCAAEPSDERELKLRIPRGEAVGVHAVVQAERLGDDEYALVHISEEDENGVLGGLGFVVVADKEQKR